MNRHLPYDVDPGVDIHALNWRMRPAEQVVVRVWKAVVGGRFTMSSAGDRAHSPWSWHYKGMAFDVTLRNVSDHVAERVYTRLCAGLGPPFQIIHHRNSHIHIECDLVAYPEWIARDIMEAVR